ncbi:UDP-4-amino-4,6-dideoxy-N-acetyl-beta-L-altrosamine transaminase [Lysinibacillus fusiformis]|uniref:UDP-4-amino-4, 6-dideoxy-N-acetyl-beta-L-altrosamine transaminase n=1 Tax=Lysinibacillus fusiformis TaxID=28031 RepID=UPI000D3D7311|nr:MULTISPECIES: UDP-4-amino-4,6-dideoxy-N-acetyl-beta-L-altrosamine transaminase [Lysinibacillus]MED4668287.1 UDP-4-amino-4,6-dideoxy-N-acetyl-beta-L-altrosamine transaminase [Lysinibacillus fusiformis]QAS58684.1 UDP-4-amino-4,6-dideoxy-N-acetyl-beta-L-altrosamine transaminase [Lysinibacillus sphaericus]RDV35318.1 UDP-4-amino-4,6-dideoxy-N-acetyl-beta-L-altrosamine transaminase [Lysinibacillus fusiformis]GED63644.1 UDP-4-amino-4,6-dideoxy-N-acetyl-beta-L-altrosami ne transaminase [Lysinibacill
MRDTYLPYGQQWLDEEDIQAVVNVLKGSFLTTGPTIAEFEECMAEYVGSKYAVAFSNGTAALHGACFVAGIGEGDEVITTPITFAASANCVRYVGGTVVFADIKEDTYNIDPLEIEKKITPNTKAIIPVHFTGQPVQLAEIHAIAEKHNLIVIEDAAHALGAEYKGEKIGAFSDMTMFSFHPVKHVTTGEGGVITTNNEDLYNKLLQFRSHGITREASNLAKNDGPWYYDMQFLGFNYRMTDIQAALGISQIRKLDKFVARRREIAQLYNEAFKNNECLFIPTQQLDGFSSWHLYIIKLNLENISATRKEIFEALLAQNIGVNVHYIPVHTLSYYQELGYAKGSMPKAEELYEAIITLPLFPKMSNEDAKDVINSVIMELEKVKK